MNNARSQSQRRYWALRHASWTLGLAAICLLLFVVVTIVVLATNVVQNADQRLLSLFADIESQLPGWTLTIATWFQTATSAGMTVITALLVIYWLITRDKHRFFLMLIGVGGAELLWLGVVFLLGRPRPEPVTAFGSVNLPSYPSGHVMVNAAFYGVLVYMLLYWSGLNEGKWRWALWGIVAVILILIGLNRLLFSVHYASDLVGGYLLGIAWTAFVLWFLEWYAADHWD